MTRENDKPETVRKIVVVFDISSSTKILEDLKRTDNLTMWRDLHISLKRYLESMPNMEMYKFMGDGWILLFEPDIHSAVLHEFLKALTSFFMSQFLRVHQVLQRWPDPTGLTFGIDTGELIRLQMNEQYEYLGRAINVAARLQGEAKAFIVGNQSNVALFSRSSFNSLQPYNPYYGSTSQTVNLRNISDGEKFQCYLIQTLVREEASL
jgi:class 3 adenylate cyclase